MNKSVRILGVTVISVALSSMALARKDEPLIPSPQAVKAAQTPQEQTAIALAYEQEAAHIKKLAEMHRTMAKTYGELGMDSQAKHCNDAADKLDAAAKEELAVAAGHRVLSTSKAGK
jgi:hypothetical protein